MAGFDEMFDWVVVGSGAGSMSSGLLMRQTGKSVVILEKTGLVGGTTAKSGGVMWIPNNRFMHEAGDTDCTESALVYLDAVCGDSSDTPGTSRERRLAYVVEAPKMIDFLVAQGIALERAGNYWPDYYDELPGGCKTTRAVVAKPFDKNRLGPVWAPRLRKGCFELPVRLHVGREFAFMKHSWRIKFNFLKVGAVLVLSRLAGMRYVTAGAALQGRMLEAALKASIDIRIETPVREMIVEHGKVVGVIAEAGGKPRRIGARLGVLVNAGGFAHNQAMRDRYMPGTRAEWSMAPEGDTGDMHVELERIGGVLAQMDQMVGNQMTRAPGFEGGYLKPPGQSLAARPGAIVVDQSGVRYTNEGGSYELFCETMLMRNKTVPAIPSWTIFDQCYAENYRVAGKWVGRRRKPPGFVESGYLKIGGTIEELAAKIGAPSATLRATVDRWNGFVDKGADEDFGRGAREYDKWLGDPFHRPNPTLGRIDKGPFYAVDMVPGDVGTYGGVVIDANARVLKVDGTPIPGLYACGVTTASIMGGVYPGAGASIGPSMTFGWIAARHATGLAARTVCGEDHLFLHGEPGFEHVRAAGVRCAF